MREGDVQGVGAGTRFKCFDVHQAALSGDKNHGRAVAVAGHRSRANVCVIRIFECKGLFIRRIYV